MKIISSKKRGSCDGFCDKQMTLLAASNFNELTEEFEESAGCQTSIIVLRGALHSLEYYGRAATDESFIVVLSLHLITLLVKQ